MCVVAISKRLTAANCIYADNGRFNGVDIVEVFCKDLQVLNGDTILPYFFMHLSVPLASTGTAVPLAVAR